MLGGHLACDFEHVDEHEEEDHGTEHDRSDELCQRQLFARYEQDDARDDWRWACHEKDMHEFILVFFVVFLKVTGYESENSDDDDDRDQYFGISIGLQAIIVGQLSLHLWWFQL